MDFDQDEMQLQKVLTRRDMDFDQDEMQLQEALTRHDGIVHLAIGDLRGDSKQKLW